MVFEEAQFAEIWRDLMPTFEAHWSEVGRYTPLSMNVDAYCAMQDAGLMRIFVARDPEIVGYAFWMVIPRTLHQDHRTAQGVALWMDPDYRDGKTGASLIRFCEETLRKDGPLILIYDIPSDKRGVALLFGRLGYSELSRNFSKRLA